MSTSSARRKGDSRMHRIAALRRNDGSSLIRINSRSDMGKYSLLDTFVGAELGEGIILYTKTRKNCSLALTVDTSELDNVCEKLNKLIKASPNSQTISLCIDSDISVITAFGIPSFEHRRLCGRVTELLLLNGIDILGISSDDMHLAVIVKLNDASRAVDLLKRLIK